MTRATVFCAVLVICLLAGYGAVPLWLGSLGSYGTQGCVIAPDAPRPVAAKAALVMGQAQEHDGWLLVGPAHCTIQPPQITAVLKATDPDVAPFISAVDAYPDSQGCFLNTFEMQAHLQRTRGWSADRAFTEYLKMFGAGLFSGEWRFFSETPLSTPVGPQYTGGVCADVPYAAALKQSHADMLAGFDGFIRANAPALSCEEGGSMKHTPWAQAQESAGLGPVINGFHGFEIGLALLASDWVEGVSNSYKGLPRPPLCLKEPL